MTCKLTFHINFLLSSMKNAFSFTLILLLHLSLFEIHGQEKKTANMKPPANHFKCDVNFWAAGDEQTRAFMLYPEPVAQNGKKIFLNCLQVAHVRQSKNGWLQVDYFYDEEDCEDTLIKGKPASSYNDYWVKPGTLFTGVAGSELPTDTFKLFSYASDKAKVIGYAFGYRGWRIYGANGKWAKVKGFSPGGKERYGWIPPVVRCINPHTTCVNDIDKYIYSVVPSVTEEN